MSTALKCDRCGNYFDYSFFIFDKYAKFIETIGRSQFRAIKEMNNHKVYYWEDIR